MRTAQVIVNSESGTAVAHPREEIEKLISTKLTEAGWLPQVAFVAPADVDRFLQRAVAAKPDLLVAGGGDGTVRAAAHAVRGTGIPLGILPLGTFNALARDLQLPLDLEKAINVLSEGQVRHIDVAEVNRRPFLGICVMGMHADVTAPERPGAAWWSKALQMAWYTMRYLPNYRRLSLELEMNQAKHTYRTRFVAISNNPLQAQAGLTVPPRETLDSGNLVAYIGTHQTRWSVVAASLAYAAGRLDEDPNLVIEQARSITVASRGRRRRIRLLVDGEKVTESLPLHFKLNPRQLQVMAPPPVLVALES